jgi:sigma-B regulation protein RsbU (phosphoserine phosphatase)
MKPGDLILLFTDGVTEAEGPSEQFGEDRLMNFLKSNRAQSLEQIRDSLIAEIDRFTCDTPQSDDITLLLVKRNN